jgi:hypothetical protein
MLRLATPVIGCIALSTAFSIGIHAQAPGDAASRCSLDFDSTYAAVTRDYAGFRDRMQHAASRIRALADTVREASRQVASDSLCTELLNRWIAVFGEHDHHIQLWQPRPANASPGQRSASTGSGDPGRPTIEFRDDSLAVITLPNFNQRYRPLIDSLVDQHRTRLLNAPYLIVDVRRNPGGWSGAYLRVMELLYTNPIRRETFEIWSSPWTISSIKEMMSRPGATEELKAQGTRLIASLEANPATFVSMGDVDSLVMPTVHPLPRRVGVLTGRGCASSCEQFVMDAMYSSKVTVYGKGATAGFLDYGNVMSRTLPSGIRRLSIPSSRSKRLPARPLDYTGLVPQVLIPADTMDVVSYVARVLRGS